MTTNFGRLRSDIGGIVMPDYSVPLIDKTPPQSLWAKRTRARGKNAIDPMEALVFNKENVDSIKDRIVESNLRKNEYGVNQGIRSGIGMSHSGMMNPTLLGNNLSYSMRNENPRKAFRYGYYRPIMKNSFDVYRPIGKAPDRGIVVEGRRSKNTTEVADMLPDPSASTIESNPVTIEGKSSTNTTEVSGRGPDQSSSIIESNPVTVEGRTAVDIQPSNSTPLSFARKLRNTNIGRDSYWESLRSNQPTAVFRGTMETVTSGMNPKFKDIEPISAASNVIFEHGNGEEPVIPFIPEYIIREVEPITVSSAPITNIVNFVDVIDSNNMRSTQLRKTLPKLLGSRFQVKIYDTDSGNYVPVHEKHNPQILAAANVGGGVSIPIEGMDTPIKLKNYRMITYTANNSIPVLILEPWVLPKTKDRLQVQISSNIGSSNAETTDLFLPSFKQKEQAALSVTSEGVYPKRTEHALSSNPKLSAIPVGTRGEYFDRVSVPVSHPNRPTMSFRQKAVLNPR